MAREVAPTRAPSPAPSPPAPNVFSLLPPSQSCQPPGLSPPNHASRPDGSLAHGSYSHRVVLEGGSSCGAARACVYIAP